MDSLIDKFQWRVLNFTEKNVAKMMNCVHSHEKERGWKTWRKNNQIWFSSSFHQFRGKHKIFFPRGCRKKKFQRGENFVANLELLINLLSVIYRLFFFFFFPHLVWTLLGLKIFFAALERWPENVNSIEMQWNV